jgi:uncharacterized protein YndB with AHSA1/START domain
MYEIHVTITLDAPPARVFDLLADHERFFREPLASCRLLAAGRDHRNGLGAIRQVTAEGRVFTEEITAFDPPRHFEYVVRHVIDGNGKPLRIRHQRGWLDLSADGASTRVDWHSRFGVTIPLVGWFAERLVGPRAAAGFRRLLERAKADLEG